MNELYLGIDTSNYTTSVAVTDSEGNVISDRRKLLPVKKGERGLRQQEALFHHIKNFPEIIKKVRDDVDIRQIKSIGVSARPRNVEGSYMPCFEAGRSFAISMGAALNVPIYEFSHQEGHIRAATDIDECICFHLSGGTTEFLKVVKNVDKTGYKVDIIGHTLDISFGQLIDRIGVAMGFDFPAGKAIDSLAFSSDRNLIIKGLKPFHISGNDVNLSGAETQFGRIISDYKKDEIAITLMNMTAECLDKIIATCKKKYPDIPIVLAGGVSQSLYLKECLKDKAIFAEYGADNAIGISKLGGMAYATETCKGKPVK